MSDRLTGKIAIVTGAGSRGPGLGNGKAAAILFAREGARVLCVDQLKERAEETVGIIRGEGGEATAFAGDVTRAADCRSEERRVGKECRFRWSAYKGKRKELLVVIQQSHAISSSLTPLRHCLYVWIVTLT